MSERGSDDRQDHFTLEELCEQAGVTVRTVRYYISEGLLPPPVGHGTNARYTSEHRDRLNLIAALKEQYLPLREIRRTLGAMTPHEIGETATTIRPAPMAPAAAPLRAALEAPPAVSLREEPSAAEYISDVLERSGTPRQRRAPVAPPAPAADAAWRRVPITAEAELLIEEEAWQRRREQIESLVAWARRILNGT